MMASGNAAAVGATWNGGICATCGSQYLGSHTCSIEDLLQRANQLRDMALARFEALNPKPTRGPKLDDEEMTPDEFDEAFAKGTPADIVTLRQRGCPCRTQNGGSGICGCILGGPQVTC